MHTLIELSGVELHDVVDPYLSNYWESAHVHYIGVQESHDETDY